jgi:transcriptional regulator with XRE-family HTH domain
MGYPTPWQDCFRCGKILPMTPESAPEGAIPVDTFAARLKLARLHAGNISIRAAADRCGLTHESWSGWERGGKPRDLIDTAERISKELGVDLNWLLRGGPLTPEDRPRRKPATRVLARGGEAHRLTSRYSSTGTGGSPRRTSGHVIRPGSRGPESPIRAASGRHRPEGDRPVRLSRPGGPHRV